MKVDRELIDELEDAWLNLSRADIKNAKFRDPLKIQEDDRDKFGITPVRMMTNPEYVEAAARILLNVQLLPIQSAIMAEMWERPFPMLIGSRGLGKTSILAFYSMLKMCLTPRNKAGGPGCKIVITGAGFRQAKQVFEYMEGVWANSPRLRSLCSQDKEGDRAAISRESDRYTMRIGPNNTIAIPLGNGEKVRGLRANIVLADEFNSISPDIFETVIQGFAAVSSNPIEAVRIQAKIAKAKQMGITEEMLGIKRRASNQIVISGTAGYDFEHFAEYWKKYKIYIESMGREDKLSEVFKDDVPDDFNWKDYSIIRIPYTKVPAGFLDPKILVRAQATVHSGTFAKEYGAVFSKDSLGFFKRTLIDSCVANDKNLAKPEWPSWCPVVFDPTIRGSAQRKHIIAIDPASEVDKFSIVILELHENHARIVYCWTTNKKEHQQLHNTGMAHELDFYAYCARRIRQLLQLFPSDKIGIDAQGGGIAVMNALRNKNNLLEGEKLILPIQGYKNEEGLDAIDGLHIVEPIQFANYEWTYNANHGLRQDMESKSLLFPRFDQVAIEVASAKDYERQAEFEAKTGVRGARAYDTFEDCTLEIEELKEELTTIVVTRTGTGPNSRDRWDTPEKALPNGKKGRMRKDRYSALVIANMMARQLRVEKGIIYGGGLGGLLRTAGSGDGNYFESAPQDWRDGMQEFYDDLDKPR
jgi:hypothetical protein